MLYHGEPEADSPLNPFRLDGDWPQQVRGEAILALAQLVSSGHRLDEERFLGIIELALTDSLADLRLDACHAVHIGLPVTQPLVQYVIACTRDPVAKVAALAIDICRWNGDMLVNNDHLKGLLVTLEFQSRSADVSIRRNVAGVIQALSTKSELIQNQNIMMRLDSLRTVLNRDVSRSVRSMFKTA